MSQTNKNSGATASMFSGDLSFMNCPRVDLADENFQSKLNEKIAVLGVPFDNSTSNRPGTRFGPRAVRAASKMLSWERVYGWEDPIFQNDDVLDLGDLDFDYGRTESILTAIDQSYQKIISAGAKPLTIGGDHFISYPIIKSLSEFHQEKIALVQFDAHTDTWPDEPGRIDHGTGFYRAVKSGVVDPSYSIQVGIRTYNADSMGMEIIDGFETHQLTADGRGEALAERILNRVGNLKVYLTVDIDVLDPAYAPGTGTPTMGGMTSIQLLSVLQKLKGINLVGADVVEVSPPYDQSEITALAGANIAAYLGQLLYLSKIV